MPSPFPFAVFAQGALAALLGTLVAQPARLAQDPIVKPTPQPQDQPKGERKTNRLSQSTSPYLRQHQHNPVDWYPWGPEALARAKAEDKPIFLSIGYAACHWCHVMEHESFENEAISKLMNENFVCIKVDREERPDLDEIYMGALQAMGQQGGWPLSIFLSSDARPFYGGTYFPPEDSYGRPGFTRVLEHLAKAWREQRKELLTGADQLAAHLQKVLAPVLPPGEPTAELLQKVLPQSQERFDAQFGGFGYGPQFAPKFPHASELQVLLRLPAPEAQTIVQKSLAAMREGGMYDQLGGGFHRYSTDRQWLVPHFEKMLYDNVLLVSCYLDAYLRTGEADDAVVARETLDYLLREMQHERGGFYSSQDADSEGVEGKFFVWQLDEVRQLLGSDAPLAARHFGITAAGNWEHSNVLVLGERAEAIAAGTKQPLPDVTAAIAKVRSVLLAARAKRVHPGTDDKILCAWNGLAISAFATGYRVLGDERYLQAAQRAAAFVLQEMVQDGRCLRSWHSGKAQHQGYLEDHAMLADGLLSLFEADGDPRWLAASQQLLQRIHKHFRAEDGGLWFTADDHEELLARTKSTAESSIPSGAAIACRAFLRAGLLLGDMKLYEDGLGVLRSNHALLAESPNAAPALVQALQFHLADPREIVIAGDPADARTRALLQAAWRSFPGDHVVAVVYDGNRAALDALSSVFADKVAVDGVPAAYVCRRGVCDSPVTDPKLLGGVR